MSDIPCENCITFAVCNAQISNICPYDDVIYYLMPKCSLIIDYTKYYNNPYSFESVLKVARFFRPHGIFVN